MNLRNTRDEYGLISKILHWLIAIMMISLIAIGWYMSGLDDESVMYWRMLDLHEALGLAIFIPVAVKAAWLLISPNPDHVPDLAAWERIAARVVQGIFLIAMVVLPLTGFLFVASNGEVIKLYNLIEIPDIGRLSKGVRSVLSDVHYYGSYGCAALIGLHAAAALKHHFVDLNATLRRMMF